jgi:hypothetical protein
MTWTAETPDGVIEWDGGLEGDPAAVNRVRYALDSHDDSVAVTPTGPFVARDVADELAILGVLFELYGRAVVVTGQAPDLTFGAPPDAHF